MAMNPILEPGALTNEKRATAKTLATAPRLDIGNPDRREEIHAEQLRKCARIAWIGLGAGLPNQLDVKGVGDVHRMALLGEARRQPLPVQRRLKPDRHGTWGRVEPPCYGSQRRLKLSD